VCFAGEAGAEVRGDTGRAQGLQRAAAGRRGDDEMGDVRGAGHHAVGALRLKIVDDQCVAFVLFFSFLFFSFRAVLSQFWCPFVVIVVSR